MGFAVQAYMYLHISDSVKACKCYVPLGKLTDCIRESVDSLYRDGADMPIVCVHTKAL